MPVKKGDFALIDYTAKVKETGETVDTTIEEIAKKERIYKERTIYEPMLVVVGEGWILKSLDDDLAGLETEKTATIEIPPEKGFGLRDPNKIKLMPIRRFRAKNITPYPGMQVEIEGKLAVVRSVGAGRVQIDFNPPLAGKTLIYEVTVKKILESREEKLKALIHRRIPAEDQEKFIIKLGKREVKIEVPEEVFYVEGLQFAKRGITSDVQKFFPDIEVVTFTERFKKREAAPSAAAPQQQASAQEGTQ